VLVTNRGKMPLERTVRYGQIRKWLGVCRGTVRGWVDSGKIRRIGARKYDRDDIRRNILREELE
jgi:hypothetical protein